MIFLILILLAVSFATGVMAANHIPSAPPAPPLYTEFDCVTSSYSGYNTVGKGRRYPSGVIMVQNRFGEYVVVEKGGDNSMGCVKSWRYLSKP